MAGNAPVQAVPWVQFVGSLKDVAQTRTDDKVSASAAEADAAVKATPAETGMQPPVTARTAGGMVTTVTVRKSVDTSEGAGADSVTPNAAQQPADAAGAVAGSAGDAAAHSVLAAREAQPPPGWTIKQDDIVLPYGTHPTAKQLAAQRTTSAVERTDEQPAAATENNAAQAAGVAGAADSSAAGAGKGAAGTGSDTGLFGGFCDAFTFDQVRL